MNSNSITFVVLTLENSIDQLLTYKKNLKVFPNLKIFKSVNGFDEDLTLKNFKHENITFHSLSSQHLSQPINYNWGTLACWLTKYKALRWQIENNIPYLCFIEDDLLISEDFVNYCYTHLSYTSDSSFIRLGKWGEGYITSLEGAKNIIREFSIVGITKPIDMQLRSMKTVEEINISEYTPWLVLVKPEKGQRTKTKPLDVSKLSNL